MTDILSRRGTVLVVAAHPDDEVLGCGGTLARHAAAGDIVHVLIMAEGATARRAARCAAADRPKVQKLQEAARKAAAALGTMPPSFGDLPDNRLDGIDLLDIIKVVERAVEECAPAVVYTHHGGDLNIDHQIVHRAVTTACRPLPGSPVHALYAFETPSSTEWATAGLHDAFQPMRFVDIHPHMDAKLAALRAYELEMRPSPHPRSFEAVEALARWRGNSVGFTAAEAFMVLRERV